MTETRGSVVYLGSGLCSDLDTHLASNPERIYLVEPNPGLADDIAQLCDAHATVEHLDCGVTVSGGRQRLDVYNFFDLSSFSEPQDLLKVYPGALVETAPQIQTLTPTELMARLNLPDAAPHKLLVETTGIEHALLEAFISSGTLGAFADLFVRMPAHTLFKGSRDIAQVDALLETAGYQKKSLPATAENADWQMHHYRFNSQTYRLIGLEEKNSALDHALDQINATLAQTTTDLTAERDQALAEAKTAEAKCKDAIDKAEEIAVRNADLTAERDQVLETGTKAQAAVTALEKKNQALHAERVMALRVQTRLQSSHIELQERFEALHTKYATQQTLVASLIKQLEDSLPTPKPAAQRERARKTGASKK